MPLMAGSSFLAPATVSFTLLAVPLRDRACSRGPAEAGLYSFEQKGRSETSTQTKLVEYISQTHPGLSRHSRLPHISRKPLPIRIRGEERNSSRYLCLRPPLEDPLIEHGQQEQ